MTTTPSPSAAIWAHLNHPVIDADGHTIEFLPAFLDYLRQVGGPKIVNRYSAAQDVPHFYFGCEADDPINAWAFNTKVNPFGAKLRAIFSSDIGHRDVTDMRTVVAEAYELVEKGLLTEEDFRDFVFVNPVTLWTGMNPAFFAGTAVEEEVDKFLLSS